MPEDLVKSLAERRLIEALSQLPANYLSMNNKKSSKNLQNNTVKSIILSFKEKFEKFPIFQLTFQKKQLIEREKRRLALTGGDGPNNINNNEPQELPDNSVGKV